MELLHSTFSAFTWHGNGNSILQAQTGTAHYQPKALDLSSSLARLWQ
jgi:hypothetical protein